MIWAIEVRAPPGASPGSDCSGAPAQPLQGQERNMRGHFRQASTVFLPVLGTFQDTIREAVCALEEETQ